MVRGTSSLAVFRLLLFLLSELQRLDPLERLDKELDDPDDPDEDGVAERGSSPEFGASSADGAVDRYNDEVSSIIDLGEGNGGTLLGWLQGRRVWLRYGMVATRGDRAHGFWDAWHVRSCESVGSMNFMNFKAAPVPQGSLSGRSKMLPNRISSEERGDKNRP
jgi:hypothetical protein